MSLLISIAKPIKQNFFRFCALVFFCASNQLFAVSKAPDPYTHQPYAYEEMSYNVNVDGVSYYVRGFLPKLNGKSAPMTNRPLVIIMHGHGYSSPADPSGNGHHCPDDACYIELAKHLARNGYVVIRPDWDSGDYSHGDTEFQLLSAQKALIANIQMVYGLYDANLSDKIALIGHSVGGAGIVRYANDVNGFIINGKSLKLKSLISMGASVKPLGMDETKSLYRVTRSFLTMDTAHDRDSWGAKYDNVMKTGFKLLDDAGFEGSIFGSVASNFPTRDSLFFYRSDANQNTSPFSHKSFTVNKAVIGYAVAYLNLHVNGDNRYQSYFKHKLRPKGLPEKLEIYQQHMEPEKRVVANFKQKSRHYLYNNSGTRVGRIRKELGGGNGTIKTQAGDSWKMDRFSPHKTQVMNVSWDRRNSGNSSRLRFVYYNNHRPDVRDYRYLSFRISQRTSGFDWPDRVNPEGDPMDFYVRLFQSNNRYSRLVPLSEYGQEVPYPKVRRQLVAGSGGTYMDVTKHVMHTVLLPLKAFTKDNGQKLDLRQLKEIKFYFTGKGAITLDSLEFIK